MHAPVYFRVTYWVADFQNFLRRLNGNHRQLNPSGAHLLSTIFPIATSADPSA
ncbi:hypothetical protein M404DRAFT_1003507 [Pisolithus tinctorius Marx 270]|uniref:Uncharacterized protein n=1 Tax=Pisolithus tinctorius Marx 270 TaxID=870435 RepID=A0A0C3JTH6_PISTI|nr:hypothetical protein M404DRAFT_1003507 [Pisolithus tinctorius Marx 270]